MHQHGEQLQQLKGSLAALKDQNSALLAERDNLHSRVAAAEDAAAVASIQHESVIAAAKPPHAVAVSQRWLAEGAAKESDAQPHVFSIAADARAAMPDQYIAAMAAAKEAIAVTAPAGVAAAQRRKVIHPAAAEFANLAAGEQVPKVAAEQAAAAEAANSFSALVAENKRLKDALKASVDAQEAALIRNSAQLQREPQPHQTGDAQPADSQLTRLTAVNPSTESCHLTDVQLAHVSLQTPSAPAEETVQCDTSKQVAAAAAQQRVKAPVTVLGDHFLAHVQSTGTTVQDQVAALQSMLKQLQEQQSAAEVQASQATGPLHEGIAQQGATGGRTSLKGPLVVASAAKLHDMPHAAATPGIVSVASIP